MMNFYSETLTILQRILKIIAHEEAVKELAASRFRKIGIGYARTLKMLIFWIFFVVIFLDF